MIKSRLHALAHTGLWLTASLLFGPASAHAATYQFTSSNFDAITNFAPPCGGGTCSNFAAGGQVTGSFTTAAPLPANLPLGSILPLVTGWMFDNGVVAMFSGTPSVRVLRFEVATDAAGNITQSNVQTMRWTVPPGPGPHAPNDRTDWIMATTGGGITATNAMCVTVATSPAGVADTCSNFFHDPNPPASASSASYPSGSWTTVPTVSINSLSLAETNAGTVSFTFTVQLSATPTAPVSLNWATSSGTANAGSDYTAANGTLNWAAGDGAPKTIVVQVNGDTTVEPDETFFVTLSAITGADPGTVTGTGTIVNDDPAPPAPGGGATAIPTLSEWGLILLSGLLALGTTLRVRRRA
jgi:hypothetical protein